MRAGSWISVGARRPWDPAPLGTPQGTLTDDEFEAKKQILGTRARDRRRRERPRSNARGASVRP